MNSPLDVVDGDHHPNTGAQLDILRTILEGHSHGVKSTKHSINEIASGKAKIAESSISSGRTRLMDAALSGQEETVHELLLLPKSGSETRTVELKWTVPTRLGGTPLHSEYANRILGYLSGIF